MEKDHRIKIPKYTRNVEGTMFFSCFTCILFHAIQHKTFLKIKVLKIVPYFIMSVPKDIVFILGQKKTY